MRQLSRDSRMKNPDEKLILLELQTPNEPEVLLAKANTKRSKESANAPPKAEPVSASKTPKEANNKPLEVVSKVKANAAKETDEFCISEKPKESPAANGIDGAKLKEMKREEEIAKARQALKKRETNWGIASDTMSKFESKACLSIPLYISLLLYTKQDFA